MRRGRTQRSGVEGLHGRIHARRGRRAAKGRETAPVRTLLSRPIALGTATGLAGRRETVNGAPAASIVTRVRSTRTRRRPRTSIGGARSSHGNRRRAIGSGRRARRQTPRLARRSGFSPNTAAVGLPRRSGSNQNTAKAGQPRRSGSSQNTAKAGSANGIDPATAGIGRLVATRLALLLIEIDLDLRGRTGATKRRRRPGRQNVIGIVPATAAPAKSLKATSSARAAAMSTVLAMSTARATNATPPALLAVTIALRPIEIGRTLRALTGATSRPGRRPPENASGIARATAGMPRRNATGIGHATADLSRRSVHGIANATADLSRRSVHGIANAKADLSRRSVNGIGRATADLSRRSVNGIANATADLSRR